MQWVSTKFPWIAIFIVFLSTSNKCLRNLESNFSHSLDHIDSSVRRELNVSSSGLMDM